MSIDIDNLLDSKHVTVSTNAEHKATVTVGKDTIEAEYYTFDRSDWWTTKKMNFFENVWDLITTPYYRVKHWIKDTYWEIRYGFQRMFKGYDSVDTFETFAKFRERYLKILTQYRKNHIGYVWGMTADEWDAIIDEMIYHLRYMDEETVTEELEKDVPNDWSASHKTINNILENHKNSFFELFSKYFYDLWD
jgi:hypothetical protein